ncbi:uncharacterized protein CBL_07811 [Carabus blaptoides fortunei]
MVESISSDMSANVPRPEPDCMALSSFFTYWRNLVNQETRFQAQLTELTERLRVRETETSELRAQMESLQQDVNVKSSSVDRLQAELQAAHKETEFVRQKLKQLQEEICTYKQKNLELVDSVEKKSDEYKTLASNSNERTAKLEATVSELNEKLQGLETQMNSIKEERDKLKQEHNTLEDERDEEKKIVQEALEVAEQEKQAIKKRWEEDFEKLRTVNTDREQQMLDDFEWKLREVQQSCKRRLDEKERQTVERIEQMEQTIQSKVQKADKQLNEVVHLKSYEAEVTQLRGLTHDQQHSLRTMSTRVDELQATEQHLQEEIARLHMSVDLEKQQLAAQQRRHDKDLADKERALQIRLEKQRGEVAVQWEQKLHQECARLKAELEQLHAEEKHLAVELVKVQRDREFDTVKEQWQRKLEQHVKELAELKETLAKKETKHQTEMERLQTNTDRDIVELRRELDKAEMGYHERVEKLLEDHELQLERLNEDADRRLKDAEQNCQMQVSCARATVELVKEQMERDTQDKLERLSNEHQSVLDEQWQRLTESKQQEVERIENEYKGKFDQLKEQFTIVQKTHQHKETELLAVISELKASVQAKDTALDQLQGTVDTLQGGVQVLNQEITNQDKHVTKIRSEAEQRIGELQHELKLDRDTLHTERQEYIKQMAHVQKQSQTVIEQLQRKCQCLTKLFEEMRARYERRESRPEDLNVISDLRGVIAEQEKDLAVLNEQKRYYQMELLKCTKQPTVAGEQHHVKQSVQLNGHESDIETSCDLPDNTL